MNVTLKEKEKTAVEDLQTQEKSCMEKYRRYEQEAKDPVLKEATYTSMSSPEDKESDCFLATDAIGTEKLVSGEYNTNVFVFAEPCVRKLLADIQIEEQNHAEMLFKYKMANAMA